MKEEPYNRDADHVQHSGTSPKPLTNGGQSVFSPSLNVKQMQAICKNRRHTADVESPSAGFPTTVCLWIMDQHKRGHTHEQPKQIP